MAARKPSPPAKPTSEPDTPEQTAPVAQERTAVESAYVDALYRERDGYLRYGRKNRADGVTSELRRLGAPLERAIPAPGETA
ncbi:hypothetical protein [Streptomyces uncialis]|uniref:hypothetical protein n=1 Tax=Streptomyces uncialis TaxID=1048205 RepID=UPI003407DAF1